MAEPTPTTDPVKTVNWKAPISIRAKDDYKDFLNKLIEEKGMSPSMAIEHCIRIAMNPAVPPAPAPAPRPDPPKPAPSGSGRYSPVGAVAEFLSMIMRSRKLDESKAIDYCITYTRKNDWL